MCYDPVQMADVLSKYPDLMMTFDMAHAQQSGMENAMGFIHKLGNRIINVHSGSIYNDSLHYPGYLAQNPETTEILQNLKKIGYNKDLIIEIDDKLIDGCQSRSDKISMLVNEKRYLEKVFYKM